MVNWKTFKIIEKKLVYLSDSDRPLFINFKLNGDRPSKSLCMDCINFIYCDYSYPFTAYQVGDSIEIDRDKVICEETNYGFREVDGAIRKVDSSSSTSMTIGSTTITREHGLAMARRLDEYVEQSGGANEYTESIEARDNQGNSIKFSLSSKRANN